MRRRHRQNINAAFHAHVLTFSCYRGFKFLASERTCQWLAEAISQAKQEHNFALWSYVFMLEHVHLIVWPREAKYDIADIRRAIKAPVGQKAIDYMARHAPEWLPRITRQRGAQTERLFWQSGGGYDRNIVCGKTLLKEIHYLHDNPVRKQFVLSQADWKWSSAAWFNEGRQIPLMVDPIPYEWLMDT